MHLNQTVAAGLIRLTVPSTWTRERAPVNLNTLPIMNSTRCILLTAVLSSITCHVLGAPSKQNKVVMHPATSASFLQDFLSERGLSVSSLTPKQLVDVSLAFFQKVPASGLSQVRESDMLLFQWGVFNWGQGERFQLDITRQFIESESMGDDGMSQLRLTAYFAPTKALREIKVSNRWCETKKQLEKFANYIATSEAFLAVRNAKPIEVTMAWHKV